MLLSNRTRHPRSTAGETATAGSGSDDTGPTPPTSANLVHSDDELRRATTTPRRPPPKRRAALWRSAAYGLGIISRPDIPLHIKSLPNLVSVDDHEHGTEADSCRTPSNVSAKSRLPRRKGTASTGLLSGS